MPKRFSVLSFIIALPNENCEVSILFGPISLDISNLVMAWAIGNITDNLEFSMLDSAFLDQLIEHIIPLAIEYRRRFGKSLGITGEVGEYKASRLLKLERASGNINEGFDAIDPKNKKVQIKSRICQRSQGRTSVFKNYGFYYALLVLLDDDYEVIEMYQVECKKIRDSINT